MEILEKILELESMTALEVDESAFDIFDRALEGEIDRETAEKYFVPHINGKLVKWDDVVGLADELKVIPHLAGGK